MSGRRLHFSVPAGHLANIGDDDFASLVSQLDYDLLHEEAALSGDRVPSDDCVPSDICVPRDGDIGDVASRSALAALRIARRDWIRQVGAVDATVPVWRSRLGFISDCALWATSAEGRAVLSKHSLSARMWARVIPVLAKAADSADGRHCAITNAAVGAAARCSSRTVTTVRRILAIAELGVEVYRGTGNPEAKRSACRPSVWHLVSRRRPITDQRREPVDNFPVCDLPSLTHSRSCLLLGTTGQDAAHSADVEPNRPKKPNRKPPRKPRQPLPIALQRFAAQFLARTCGFTQARREGQHVTGQVSRALLHSHLDLESWTPDTLTKALNQHMKDHHLYWPDQITRPGAFMAAVLRPLPSRPPTQVPVPADRDPISRSAPSPAHHPGKSAAAQRALDEIRLGLRRPKKFF